MTHYPNSNRGDNLTQSTITKPTGNSLELGDVQETLLIPLYLRAVESRRRDAICRDPKAIEIVDSLEYDFRKFDSWILQLDVAIRTELFDSAVQNFIRRHPDGVVVNLGAGLDARFQRLDNGQLRWFDLDMPDSMELRHRYFEETNRNRFLALSLTDPKWLDEVDVLRGDRPVFIMAEGLFCYLHDSDIRELFRRVADRWPGAEIVFQSISPEFVNRQSEVAAVKATKAKFHWGIRTGREIESWAPDYRFLDEWAFIDCHPRRWGWIGWGARLLPWKYRELRDVMKISHIRLGDPSHEPSLAKADITPMQPTSGADVSD